MLERIDTGVGDIMAELERSGWADKTLLVFFSDNGGAPGVANNGHLRSYKSWLYEGGIRDPLIVRWPDRIKPGCQTDVPVCSIDFYPTFLDVAGAKPPAGQPLDGVAWRLC